MTSVRSCSTLLQHRQDRHKNSSGWPAGILSNRRQSRRVTAAIYVIIAALVQLCAAQSGCTDWATTQYSAVAVTDDGSCNYEGQHTCNTVAEHYSMVTSEGCYDAVGAAECALHIAAGDRCGTSMTDFMRNFCARTCAVCLTDCRDYTEHPTMFPSAMEVSIDAGAAVVVQGRPYMVTLGMRFTLGSRANMIMRYITADGRSTTSRGGAIDAENGMMLVIERCRFTGNTAGMGKLVSKGAA